MNKIVSKMIFGAALLMLAACTQDEMPDNGTTLPEGKYPLEIASVTMDVTHSQQPWNAPQTRVSENLDGMSSHWDKDDIIHVKLGNQETTYTVQDAKGTLGEPEKQLYWTKRTDNVTAWYASPETDGTINLADQSGKLAYVLQATVENASCDNSVTLNFTHALAKVRVVLTGDKASEVKNVSIKGYTACTHTDGGNVSGKSEGEIKMHPVGNDTFEANVVLGEEIAEFKVNDGEWIALSTKVNPEKGKWHKITIDVKPAGPTPITPGETITEGDYIMTGSFTQGVTLNGNNIKLTLDGVTANIGNAIKVTGGSPTLIVKGTNNSFNGNGAGILISPNASVTIEGATGNASDSKLTIKAGSSKQPGIGCANKSSCKNVTIKNVTLDVTGGSSSVDGGAAIGTAGEWRSSINDILIENSIVTATGGKGAAAIGFGTIIDPNCSINSIKIINSQITAIVQYQSYQTNGYAAGIGFPYAAESHVLTIKQPIEITSTETDPEQYFSSFKAMRDGSIVSEAIRKVGKPMNTHSHSVFSWQGVKFNGQTLGNDTGY